MAEQKSLTIKEDPIYSLLVKYQSAIASVLPKHLTPERMVGIAHKMIHRTPKLKECTALSLINAVIEISILGLEVGRTAHIIPFKNEATVIVDYKGFIELAHRSNQVASFPFKPVYEHDIFEYEEGTSRYIKHKPAREKRGELVAAYAIVNYKTGGFDFEVVLPEDIEATRKKAPGAKKMDSPWNKPDEVWTMWCKTAVRRLAKRIPQCPELQKAAYLEEIVEAGLKQNISHVTNGFIDADFKAMEKTEQEPVKKEDVTKKLDALKKQGQVTPEPEKVDPGPAQEATGPIICPDDKQEAAADYCNTICNKRNGCPAWS